MKQAKLPFAWEVIESGSSPHPISDGVIGAGAVSTDPKPPDHLAVGI